MRRLRLLLLPVGATCELMLLLACYATAVFSPRQGRRLMNWSINHLPNFAWYIGK